jgi:hypothetical protein
MAYCPCQRRCWYRLGCRYPRWVARLFYYKICEETALPPRQSSAILRQIGASHRAREHMPLTKPPQRVADRPRRSQALIPAASIDTSSGPCLTRCLPICGVVSIHSHARRRPCVAASRDPFRLAARPVPSPLGRGEACCRDHLSHLDGRQLVTQTVYVGLREDKPAEQAARGVKAAAGDPRLKRWLTLHGNAQDSASVNG